MRILTLKRTSHEVSQQADPSCLAHLGPGHISNPRSRRGRRAFNNLASTYLAFSRSGTELLVNLSGEHVYLYDLTNFYEALRYDFDESDSSSVPKLKSCSFNYPCTQSADIRRLTTNPLVYNMQSVSIPAEPLSETSISEQVKHMKEVGNELYRVGNAIEAVEQYSRAIALCPMWHILYSNRATALFSRKW